MKTKVSRNLFAIALILIGGLYVTDRLFLVKRGIASIEGVVSGNGSSELYDLSDLNGKDFQKAFKQTLVQGLQVHKTAETVGLSWGLFQVANESGAKVYACEKYPNLELILQAEGVANSGHIPTLVVRGPCLASDDGRTILPLEIPLKGLGSKLRENPILRMPIGDRGESFAISAQYLYNDWPTLWNVVSVKLANDQEVLELDGYELISLLDQALTLDFSEVR